MGSEDRKEMLKAINEVKEALGTMEKLYQRAKDSRDKAKKEEQQLSMEKSLLEGINEVKDVLANMEKLYQKEKDNREQAKEASNEKEPYNHGQCGGLAVSEVDEARKEASEAEADTSSAAAARKVNKKKEAQAEESGSGSEDEPRENTEEWTSSMPAVYSD